MKHRGNVFVTGATGFMGRALIPALLADGHRVTALVRPGRAGGIPPGVQAVAGDALDGQTYGDAVRGHDTFVHLVGTPHPGPTKARQFFAVDLRSAEIAIDAAKHAGVRHFVYLSVAHPAPVMRAYIEARCLGEAALAASGLPATIVRPWYVLGPGRRWPLALSPIYRLLEAIPSTRDSARRLGMVTLDQMVRSMTAAIASPPEGTRMLEVPAIRSASVTRPFRTHDR